MARVISAPIPFFSVDRHSIGRAVGDEPDLEDFAGAYLDLILAVYAFLIAMSKDRGRELVGNAPMYRLP
jgi:hypothetical protein